MYSMKPSELYAHPPEADDAWYDGPDNIVSDVLELETSHFYDDYTKLKDSDDGRFRVHRKFYHNVDGERGVGIYALFFDGKPFAYAMTGGRGGRDAREHYVTDAETWHAARAYTLAALERKIEVDVVGDDNSIYGFYGTFIANFDGVPRLVDSDNVNPFTGTPVYDMEKFDEVFDGLCRPLGKEIGFEDGLKDPRMLEAALKAYRSGVLGEKIDVDLSRPNHDRLVAVSVVEGQTFDYTIKTSGKYFIWAGEITPRSIGPASLAECFAEHAAGRTIDPDCAYVREAANAFGADPSSIAREVQDYIRTGKSTLAERIVGLLPKHPDVPEAIGAGWELFSLAHMAVDKPELLRFCEDAYPSLEQAKELVAHCVKLSNKTAAAPGL
jgi:hypothetical protein